MATTTTGQDKTTTGSQSGSVKSSASNQRIAGTAKHVADTVAGAAGEVSARVPEVAATTRDVFSEANRMVRAGSDQTLKTGGAFSIGMALGLLLGGASRLLVLLALVPAGLIGATLMERSGSGRQWTDTVREA